VIEIKYFSKEIHQIKKWMLMITLWLLTSCGYHLRNTVELPLGLQSILLQNASIQLKSQIQKKLRVMKGRLLTTPEPSTTIIHIIREKMNRRVLSLSSTGRVNEYELYYRLNFNLLDATGHTISDPQLIEISRDYFNNQQNMLGKNNEEQLIRNEIYHQAVLLLLNRSRIALTHQNK